MAANEARSANNLDVDNLTTTSTNTGSSSIHGDHRTDSPHRIPKFWNVNVPREQQMAECPDFLRYALENEKDRGILSTPDALYVRQTWGDVTRFIHENRLDMFQRLPSDLRLYRQYCAKLVREYGSVMKFVMQQRLGWSSLQTAGGKPFEYPDDYKILYNDWPYGVDERIVHLVVWTKFSLPPDPTSSIGDISIETRQMIQDFVDKTFVEPCGEENVIWFLNWGSLKSIHAVEHFHVMLYNPDKDFIRRITKGDVPLQQKVKQIRRKESTLEMTPEMTPEDRSGL